MNKGKWEAVHNCSGAIWGVGESRTHAILDTIHKQSWTTDARVAMWIDGVINNYAGCTVRRVKVKPTQEEALRRIRKILHDSIAMANKINTIIDEAL